MINNSGVRGRAEPLGPSSRAPRRGGSWGGVSFNITSSSGNLHSTLHWIALTQTERLRKELKFFLINNNTLWSFVWSSIIKYPCFPFWKLIFLLQKRWRNEGYKGTSDIPLYKWRVTWNYACIPLKYNYIVQKKIL